MRIVPFEPLDPGMYRELVRRALAEDFGWGDVTTETVIERDQKARAVILAKSPCVLAGLEIASEAFRQLDPSVNVVTHFKDGDRCEPGSVVAEYRGHAASLLTAERTALNFLQRLTGIATLTRKFVDAADGRITVLDTRKTTPLLRALEKYAVRCGGGVNHRMGLFDMALVKDNHVAAAGGVAEAYRLVKDLASTIPVEIEVDSLEGLRAAIESGADEVLIDNFTPDQMREAVALRDELNRSVTIEASGGLTIETARVVGASGVDYIAVGELTHSARVLDIGLDLS